MVRAHLQTLQWLAPYLRCKPQAQPVVTTVAKFSVGNDATVNPTELNGKGIKLPITLAAVYRHRPWPALRVIDWLPWLLSALLVGFWP